MKKLNLKEIQNEELKIMKEFIKICNKKSLKYYLNGGTLLGAVRHKGFIPWDDDIDLFMPRPDYNKLLDLIRNKKVLLDDNLEFTSKELNNNFAPFLKLVNKSIVLNIENKEKLDKYLWIDIFPLDGMPNDEKKCKKLINKSFILSHLYVTKLAKFKNVINGSHTKKAGIIKAITKVPLFFVNENKIIEKHMQLSKKNNYNEAKYVSNLMWPSVQKQFYKKELFDKEIELEFEDIKAKAFSGYDTYLRQNYGDYMKLPPENKRYTHSLDAYKLDKNEIGDEKNASNNISSRNGKKAKRINK